MKSLTRFHRVAVIIGTVACAAVVLCLSVYLSYRSSASSSVDNPFISGPVVSTINHEWRDIILREITSGHLVPADFETIDFSLPGDPSYGDNPEKEFFNPNGPFKAHVVPQAQIDSLAIAKGTRLIFNIRRSKLPTNGYEGHMPPGTIFDTLFVILPNVIEDCGVYSDWGNVHPTKGVAFDTKADNQVVVDDGFMFNGCVHTKDRQHIYYFQSFAQRLKKPGSETWQIY